MSTLSEKMHSVTAYLRRLLSSPTGELNRWQFATRYAIELAIHCTRALRHDKAAQMAAALTYHTLFSLMPTMVLVLVFLASFRGMETYNERFKTTVVNFLLPETLLERDQPAVDPPIPGTGAAPEVIVRPDTNRPDVIAAEEIERRRREEFHRARFEMSQRISETLEKLGSVSFGSIGAVGLLVFIYGATALLSTIERSFSMIFGVRELRPIRLRLPIHFTVIALGPLVLIAGQVMQQRFIGAIEADALTRWLAGPMVVLSPLLSSWLVLYVIFSMMPNAHVQRRAAAIGSFVSAVLWILGKEAFGYYVLNADMLTTLYGALALVPLFLFWIYITWLVVLFGLELTYTIQSMKGRKFKHLKDRASDEMLLDATWLIPVAAHVAADFAEGRNTDPDKAANKLRLPPAIVRKLLGALEQAHLIQRVSGNDDQCLYALARPADRIAVTDVLNAAATLMPAAPSPDAATPDAAAWRIARVMHDAAETPAKSQTLADLTVNPND